MVFGSGNKMAKSFDELINKTGNKNTKKIAAERTLELIETIDFDKVEKEIYKDIYKEALSANQHDYNNFIEFYNFVLNNCSKQLDISKEKVETILVDCYWLKSDLYGWHPVFKK
jgi:hypothetical protein